MSLAVQFAAFFCLLAALPHFGSILVVLLRARRAGAEVPKPLPPVTILRPVCGLENRIDETLRSAFHLDHDGIEILFCVERADDPVAAVVQRLIAEHSGVPARLLVGEDRISMNPKLNNLVKGWEAARHDWIVMADSNVLMPENYLVELFAHSTPGTGLVCSPPLGSAPDGFGADIECAFLNGFQARWQLAADAAGMGFAQGKSMLWHRPDLDRNGGIRALAALPAEDAAATQVIRGAGQRVRLVRAPFPQPLGKRSLGAVWRRQLRWARLRRVSFPAFFVPEILAGGLFPIAAAFLLAGAGIVPLAGAVLFALAWYGAEMAMTAALGWHLSWRTPLALVARDLALPVLWLAALSGSSFEWRGNAMNVRDESLVALDPAEAEGR